MRPVQNGFAIKSATGSLIAGASGSFGPEIVVNPDSNYINILPLWLVGEWFNVASGEYMTLRIKVVYNDGNTGLDQGVVKLGPANEQAWSFPILQLMDAIFWNGLPNGNSRSPISFSLSLSSNLVNTTAYINGIAYVGLEG